MAFADAKAHFSTSPILSTFEMCALTKLKLLLTSVAILTFAQVSITVASTTGTIPPCIRIFPDDITNESIDILHIEAMGYKDPVASYGSMEKYHEQKSYIGSVLKKSGIQVAPDAEYTLYVDSRSKIFIMYLCVSGGDDSCRGWNVALESLKTDPLEEDVLGALILAITNHSTDGLVGICR